MILPRAFHAACSPDGARRNPGTLSSRTDWSQIALRSIWAAPLLLALCQASHAQDPTQQEIDDGRQIYEEFCVNCHGRDMVAAGAVVFDLRKFPKDDFARFQKSVMEGKPPGMPAWGDKIGDDELKLLWAYVRGGP